MAKKKVNLKTKTNVLQQKIDAVKLEMHVNSIKKGKHTNLISELNYHSSKLRQAIDATAVWIKKEKLTKQTMELLNTIADGINVFLTSLIEDKK